MTRLPRRRRTSWPLERRHLRALCDALELTAVARTALSTNSAAWSNIRSSAGSGALKDGALATWKEALTRAGVPGRAIREVPEALADPRCRARDAPHGEHPTGVSSVSRRAREDLVNAGRRARPPPRLGEHTDAVLAEFGLTEAEIGLLRTTASLDGGPPEGGAHDSSREQRCGCRDVRGPGCTWSGMYVVGMYVGAA